MVQPSHYCKPISLKGFTLAEGMIIIAIIGIVSAISISSYISVVRSQKISAASINAAQWLDSIRKRALQQNKWCSVRVDTSAKTLEAGSLNECGSFGAFVLANASTDSQEVNLCFQVADPLLSAFNCTSPSASSSAEITFSPRGTVTTGYTFEFFINGDSAKTCTIILSPVGLIRSGRVSQNSCLLPG